MRDGWVEWLRGPRLGWVLAALVLLLVLVVGRSWISERLVPDPRMTRQLEKAQAALVAGKLSAPDGSGARELFESVLASDPDQMRAKQGLLAVREAAIARAQAALAAHKLAQASENLSLAEALSAPQVQLQPLQARLRDLQEASSDTRGLLARAKAPGVDEDEALGLYRQVLAVDADNAAAIEGRDLLLSSRLVRADKLFDAGKVSEARAIVEAVIAEDPAHTDLPPLRARLGEALAALQARQVRELEQAVRDEKAGRPDQAAARYLKFSEGDAGYEQAREGLDRLAARMARRAQRQAADFQFRRAQASLEKARLWNPNSAGIAAAEKSIQLSRQAQARLIRPANRSERERLPTLLEEAEQAIARGDFITPPGASAWDKLRVAAAISPRSKDLARLERELTAASRKCFDQALDQGQLKRAQSCLEAYVVQEASPEADKARRRMAERWLAYADERIGASDFAEAEIALAHVRHWQPAHPGLAGATTRLRTARGVSPKR